MSSKNANRKRTLKQWPLILIQPWRLACPFSQGYKLFTFDDLDCCCVLLSFVKTWVWSGWWTLGGGNPGYKHTFFEIYFNVHGLIREIKEREVKCGCIEQRGSHGFLELFIFPSGSIWGEGFVSPSIFCSLDRLSPFLSPSEMVWKGKDKRARIPRKFHMLYGSRKWSPLPYLNILFLISSF